HQFMDMCSHPYAIRVYSGFFKIDNLITNNGKEFKLMNLPYYMVSQIEKYLEWMINGFNVPSYNGFSDTTNELEDESKIYFEAKKTNNFEDTLIDTVNDTVNKNKNDTVNAVVSDTVNNVKNDTVSDTVNDTVNNTLCDAVNSSVSNSVGDTVKHRLINIVIRVNNKPGIKKQELVKILGVSEVTIKRDMQKLREIVVFLGTQKTGGYYIRKTLLDRLTER
ncbi:MAG: HTH domain-containing protein, partial [Saprospiraceae bacterium]|nr:HTH domain-containing protein [Saprospiraceae bacterium]